MPSSYTTSLRFELQFTGENVNLWGEKLNAALTRADDAVAGWTTKALTGDYALSTANGLADEARRAMLKFTGAGAFTVTVPAVSKRYDVWNACTGDLTLTNGSASVVVKAGEVVSVVTDGSASFRRVQGTDFGGARITSVGPPNANTDAATKAYVDGVAWTYNAGNLPGQSGNAGKFLMTNGSTPSWSDAFASPTISSPTITSGATIGGGLTLDGATKQGVAAIAATDINVAEAEFFTKSINSNIAFTFSGSTSGKAQAFVLVLTVSSSAAATWPASVRWPSGTTPTLGNGVHVIGFITVDGGMTWYGRVGVRAAA